ncbi:hypothetical protein Poly51_48820 [Rubripirellula tenax]|uniref:Uncharacterized protein n=1 Tax=Rubripirellula tenax TaxID=2528015 RepID=A0A5C6EJK1_9BACT|nr:hypothetical protein Poly51_48820 [Rubripirellula tenax]
MTKRNCWACHGEGTITTGNKIVDHDGNSRYDTTGYRTCNRCNGTGIEGAQTNSKGGCVLVFLSLVAGLATASYALYAIA